MSELLTDPLQKDLPPLVVVAMSDKPFYVPFTKAIY